jgi:hypothetical protein
MKKTKVILPESEMFRGLRSRVEVISRSRSKFEVAIQFARFEEWVEDNVEGSLMTSKIDEGDSWTILAKFEMTIQGLSRKFVTISQNFEID